MPRQLNCSARALAAAMLKPRRTEPSPAREGDRRRARSRSRSLARKQSPTTHDQPIWDFGPGVIQYWEPEKGVVVRFQAALVEPAAGGARGAEPSGEDDLPMLVYFSGLGTGDKPMENILPLLRGGAPRPFVLVTPLRPRKRWWCIEGDGKWSWCDGEFLADLANDFAQFVRALSELEGIDRNKVSLLGYSAGAYMVTELLACGVPAFAVWLGGLHGHGQPDLSNISGTQRRERGEQIGLKFRLYLDRARAHKGALGGIFGFHHPADRLSPWEYARQIYKALREGQRGRGLPALALRTENIALDSAKCKSCHDYHSHTFQDRAILSHVVSPEAAPPSGSATSAPSPSAPHRRIAAICGRGDLYINAVELTERSGKTRIYGEPGAGKALPAWVDWKTDNVRLAADQGQANPRGWHRLYDDVAELDSDECVVKVEQAIWQVGHLGARLVFYLNSGRSILIEGQNSLKNVVNPKTCDAQEDSEVVELVFESSELRDVVCARAPPCAAGRGCGATGRSPSRSAAGRDCEPEANHCF